MSEATNQEQTVTDTGAQQGDTVTAEVKGTDTTNESTLLDKSTDSAPSKDTQTESTAEEQSASKSDLLGDIKQPASKEEAPESYEPFTLADGKEMDASDQELLSGIMKEQGLSQENAQQAALVAQSLMDKMVAENEAAMEKTIQENLAAWNQQDPTGELTQYARNAVQALGEDMHAHLKDNGYLNDQRIMSILSQLGKANSEGKSISGKPANQQSRAYPNTPELYSD